MTDYQGRVTIDHETDGQLVRVTATFPAESALARDGTVAITLDDREWHDAAKRLVAECRAAERALDPGIIVLRVEQALRDAVERALSFGGDPEIARRRAVADVFHRVADMVVSGTIRAFNAEWSPYRPGEPASFDVWFRTRHLEGSVNLALESPLARTAP